jgi:hypothetical protein
MKSHQNEFPEKFLSLNILNINPENNENLLAAPLSLLEINASFRTKLKKQYGLAID